VAVFGLGATDSTALKKFWPLHNPKVGSSILPAATIGFSEPRAKEANSEQKPGEEAFSERRLARNF
jgi:hypothetical protein